MPTASRTLDEGRVRTGIEENNSRMAAGSDINFNPNFASCSVEALLSVPMDFIFRETRGGGSRGIGKGDSNKKKFIFSKSEVSTLLRVSMLSSELDAILLLAYDALDRSQKCKTWRNQIEEANKDPASRNARGVMLRALLPIIHVHSETAETALSHVTDETFGINRVLNELESCANDLGKFAEQNHTMADQLDCYMEPDPGHNNTLSNEKRAIAEIEEAIMERIQNMSVLAMGSSLEDNILDDDSRSNASRDRANPSITMSDLCKSLFPKQQQSEVEISQSQMSAAETLQIMHSNSRGK